MRNLQVLDNDFFLRFLATFSITWVKIWRQLKTFFLTVKILWRSIQRFKYKRKVLGVYRVEFKKIIGFTLITSLSLRSNILINRWKDINKGMEIEIEISRKNMFKTKPINSHNICVKDKNLLLKKKKKKRVTLKCSRLFRKNICNKNYMRRDVLRISIRSRLLFISREG